MKIIRLFFLLTFGLLAEFKFDVPKELEDKQLQYIIENGWNDKNTTFTQLIIQYGNKIMPDILQVMKKPLVEVNSTIDNPAPMPKFLLIRPDYMHILSYAKYLEQHKKTEKSLYIHLTALQGLNTIKDSSIPTTIYRIIIESVVVHSLEQSIKARKFTHSQIKEIKNKLSEYLLQDKKIFLDTFQYEIELSDRILRNNLQYTKTDKEKENLIETIEKLSTLQTKYFRSLSNLKNKIEEEKFIQSFEENRNKFLQENEKEIAEFLLITWDYIGSQFAKNWQDGKGGSTEDKEFVKSIANINSLKQEDINSQIGAKLLFYSGASPKHTLKTKREIDDLVKRNITLIEYLENNHL